MNVGFPAETRPRSSRPSGARFAADVKAETAATDAAAHVRVDAVELLEDQPLLGDRDAETLVADGDIERTVTYLQVDLNASSRGEYLTAFATRFVKTCRNRSRSASTGGGDVDATSSSCNCSPACA